MHQHDSSERMHGGHDQHVSVRHIYYVLFVRENLKKSIKNDVSIVNQISTKNTAFFLLYKDLKRLHVNELKTPL